VERKPSPRRREAQNPRASGTSTQPKAASDAVFDSWLENKLKSAYSSVLEEPIPEDLIRLLTQKLKD
jgi:hypothetical protein